MIAGSAQTPAPPCYAAIFSCRRSDADNAGYAEAAQRMFDLAAAQPGFLGVESARGQDGVGITVGYWRDEAAIVAWKRHAGHTTIRERGRTQWYDRFEVRVARVERAYGGRRDARATGVWA